MDRAKLLNIIENVEHKSNKELFEAENLLFEEFEKTKTLIVDLTRHIEIVSELHGKIVKEVEKRQG